MHFVADTPEEAETLEQLAQVFTRAHARSEQRLPARMIRRCATLGF